MRMGHTAVWRGKRVMVMVRDGKNFIAKFKDKTSTTIEFYDHDPIKTSEIRGITIYKAKQD